MLGLSRFFEDSRRPFAPVVMRTTQRSRSPMTLSNRSQRARRSRTGSPMVQAEELENIFRQADTEYMNFHCWAPPDRVVRHPVIVGSNRPFHAWPKRMVGIAAGWLLIGLWPAVTYAGQTYQEDFNSLSYKQVGHADSDRHKPSTGASSPISLNRAPMRNQSIHGKTIGASAATTTSTSASSILPQVPRPL